MKNYGRLALTALLLAAMLALASCGSSAGSGGSGSDGGMQGMDHEEMNGGGKSSDMKDMNHGGAGMASGMVMENGKYSDEAFIDAMVPHHEGAVEMAEVAMKNAEHEEIRRLSEDIVSAQEAEITQLKSIKQEEFGTSEVPMDMSMQDMKDMGMMMEPQELADKNPFDKAFIDNMTPHHQSAIEMAEVARKETDNPRIKTLATDIAEGQNRELAQMEQWREEWYPEG